VWPLIAIVIANLDLAPHGGQPLPLGYTKIQ
jgi:hypothetical protein